MRLFIVLVLLLHSFSRSSGSSIKGKASLLRTPPSIAAMMGEVASSIRAAKDSDSNPLPLPIALVELPLPVTGGTELDDWPGGIKQKYATLVPMLKETMKQLAFSPTEQSSSPQYIGDCGEEDSVGFFADESLGIQLICFPTLDTIPAIQDLLAKNAEKENGSLIVLINQNFYTDPFTPSNAKDFISSIETIYQIENLNVKGTAGLSVRGLLYRRFPEDWSVGRRLDEGGYERIAVMARKPSRKELDDFFYTDSLERDKNLSLLDRLKKQIPRFGD